MTSATLLVVHVRLREESDMADCVDLVRVVHELDRYPSSLPENLRGFLANAAGDAAWVAVLDGNVVGHVALHGGGSPPVMALASSSLQQPTTHLRVVARLFVSPDARGRGIGQRLLSTAAENARAHRYYPILDVVTHYSAAIRLYEAAHWRRAGTVTVRFTNGAELEEYVYLGPIPAQQA